MEDKYYVVVSTEVKHPVVLEYDTIEEFKDAVKIEVSKLDPNFIWTDLLCFVGKRIDVYGKMNYTAVIDNEIIELNPPDENEKTAEKES
jgi:hypothetical protein